MRLAILAVLLSTPAAATDQFDLVCTGTHKLLTGALEPYKQEYRVSLPTMVYCTGDCTDQGKIVRANASVIYFEEFSDADAPGTGKGATYVDRETGKLTAYFAALGHVEETTADCEPAPFKAIPPPKPVKRKF